MENETNDKKTLSDEIARGVAKALEEEKQKKGRQAAIGCGSIVAAAILIATCVVIFDQEPAIDDRPQSQMALCAVIEKARAQYGNIDSSANKILENLHHKAVRDTRRADFESLLGPTGGEFKAWRGKLIDLTDEMLGGVFGIQLRIDLGCRAELVTTNDLSTIREQLAGIPVGERVTIDGRFLTGHTKDFLKELSLTESGGIYDPELAFQMSNIEWGPQSEQPRATGFDTPLQDHFRRPPTGGTESAGHAAASVFLDVKFESSRTPRNALLVRLESVKCSARTNPPVAASIARDNSRLARRVFLRRRLIVD